MKEVECIPYRETGFFSDLILDYLDQKDTLNKFISDFPDIQAFKARIEAKQSFSPQFRESLVASLKEQYQECSIEPSLSVFENIESLSKANTFTVTTGHQLNILSGPLYFIYKIVSTINLAKRLKEEYPALNFVPI